MIITKTGDNTDLVMIALMTENRVFEDLHFLKMDSQQSSYNHDVQFLVFFHKERQVDIHDEYLFTMTTARWL